MRELRVVYRVLLVRRAHVSPGQLTKRAAGAPLTVVAEHLLRHRGVVHLLGRGGALVALDVLVEVAARVAQLVGITAAATPVVLIVVARAPALAPAAARSCAAAIAVTVVVAAQPRVCTQGSQLALVNAAAAAGAVVVRAAAV